MILSSKLGLSELTAAIILLVIAVVLSAVIFAFFYSYSNRLSNMITSSVVGGCGFSIVGVALNSTHMIIGVYNYGKSSCELVDIYILNSTTQNLITHSPIEYTVEPGQLIYIINEYPPSLKPPFRLVIYSRDGYGAGYNVG